MKIIEFLQNMNVQLPQKMEYFPLRAFCETTVCEKGNSFYLEAHLLEEFYMVYVDGEFRKDLSHLDDKIVVLSKNEAMNSYGAFLNKRSTLEQETEKDPFYLLNSSACEGSGFIFIPPNVKASLQIVHISTGGISFPRTEIVIGKGSELNLVVKEACPSLSWMTSALSFSLDMNSKCKLCQIFESDETSYPFSYVRATLKKDASFESVSINRGAKALKQDYKIDLLGEMADAKLNGIWILSGLKQSSTNVLISHLAPHTTSMQLFKGVLDDFSQGSFQGEIYVAKEAQKTQAYQLNNNIILGKRAIANSKPNLQIFADDVKASHGATITQLNEDLLFYLKTRGIAAETAKRLMLDAFCKEITDKCSYAL